MLDDLLYMYRAVSFECWKVTGFASLHRINSLKTHTTGLLFTLTKILDLLSIIFEYASF